MKKLSAGVVMDGWWWIFESGHHFLRSEGGDDKLTIGPRVGGLRRASFVTRAQRVTCAMGK